MKSLKFLAALAIPAMFAACTNEEIVVDTPQQMQDVAGAELIASGMSVNVNEGGVSSRLNDGGWQIGDQMALGWAVTGAYNSDQKTTGTLSEDLYANHLFERDANETFVTKGNIYKGWHFAYWPFGYMEKIGAKVFNINPVQEEEFSKDQYDNMLLLTARHFLTREDLDDEYQLKPGKAFKPVDVVNAIVVRTTPNDGFVDNKVLNNLKFESMKIEVSKNVFSQYAKLIPNKIPHAMNAKGSSIYTAKTAEDQVYNEEKTVLAVKNAISEALVTSNISGATAQLAKNITTNISADLVTGTTAILRAYSLPVAKQDGMKVSSIRINVENGWFTIKNVENAAEGSLAKANNDALTELADAYLEGGAMTELGLGMVGIDVNLYPEIFTPDFSDIDDYTEWNKAVDLVDALGIYNEENIPEFTIDGDIEVTDKAIRMPANCGIVVKSKNNNKIVTKATMTTWPEDLDATEVDVIIDSNVTLPVPSVVKAKSITVNEGKKLTLKGGKTTPEELNVTVINNGTVVVNKNAKVENVNNLSRIEVVYGSYVTTTGNKGIVAYVMTGSDKAYQINYLIDTDSNTSGFASVNTLVVNSGKTLKLGLTDPAGTGFDDPYNPVVGTNPIELDDLSNINVEMNGGSIVGVHGGKQSVGIVYVLKGTTNTMTDVIPAEVEIAAKTTLGIEASKNINGVKYDLDMPNTEIRNLGGTLNVEANTHINILHNTGTVDATGYKLHSYTESDTNAGKTIGDVKLCDCNPVVDMSKYGEDIKAALATFNEGQKDEANKIKGYSDLADKLNSIVADLETAKTWSSYAIYESVVAYYTAAEKNVPSTFTAMDIAKIEGSTGVEFGLE